MDMDASDKKFHCKDCQKSYKRNSDLNRHYRTKREAHICGVCNHKFNRKDNYLTHFRRYAVTMEALSQIKQVQVHHLQEMSKINPLQQLKNLQNMNMKLRNQLMLM